MTELDYRSFIYFPTSDIQIAYPHWKSKHGLNGNAPSVEEWVETTKETMQQFQFCIHTITTTAERKDGYKLKIKELIEIFVLVNFPDDSLMYELLPQAVLHVIEGNSEVSHLYSAVTLSSFLTSHTKEIQQELNILISQET